MCILFQYKKVTIKTLTARHTIEFDNQTKLFNGNLDGQADGKTNERMTELS